MSDDLMAQFTAQLAAAMRDGPIPDRVEITTAEGKEIMFYGPGPDHAEGGIVFVPAVLLSEES